MESILPEIVSVGLFSAQNRWQNKGITKKRTTTMFEIELPIEKGGISFINDDSAKIDSNLVICAKPGQLRQTKLPFKCYYIHFILKSGEFYESLMDTPTFIRTERPEKYVKLYEKMCNYFESSAKEDQIILCSLVLELIHTIIKDSEKLEKREQIKPNNYVTIERALRYIKENLTSDLSLESIADYVGMSPIHFHNCFKTATANTLRRYVEEQRIKKGENLLITTEYTLAQIAYECGFSSQSYFSFVFKRTKGVTPKEYTRLIHERYEGLPED